MNRKGKKSLCHKDRSNGGRKQNIPEAKQAHHSWAIMDSVLNSRISFKHVEQLSFPNLMRYDASPDTPLRNFL